MHEMSIAQDIIRLAESERSARGFAKVITIKVQAGAMSCFVPTALELAFQVVREGTCAAEATLDIERAQIKLRCRQCEHTTDGEVGPIACRNCGSTDLFIDGDSEINVVSLEVDE